jgi:hypothetical protein
MYDQAEASAKIFGVVLQHLQVAILIAECHNRSAPRIATEPNSPSNPGAKPL